MRLFTTAVLFLLMPLHSSCQETQKLYVCPPCAVHDTLSFGQDGVCPVCGMNLIVNTDSTIVNNISIKTGSGNFLVEGGADHKEKTITVFYHKPGNFNQESPILMVIPGSARNGWDYRDAWIEASEKQGILILSPHYSEEYYPEFWSYNLGGMIEDVKINEERTTMLSYNINNESEEWIWQDFDRIFNYMKVELALEAETYDMFGHSAGGQILHRLSLFNSDNKANRMLASNSGWYTIPSANDNFPYGLKGIMTIDKKVKKAFKGNLVVFIGQEDDENETRGHLVRSPETDKQGTHRLARGKYFYNKSKIYADSLETEFNWELKVIPGIGHDYERMSKAAAKYLYEIRE